ncbi:MAG: CoA ester lyase [Gammaproteobacteria bacterium]|nr:CoA ester lyase [Gammaproteobacteria bacterium]MDH5344927.1 CoA ester lyase [Gammaproteobacteria bacterium]
MSRSYLFVPADSERKLLKAADSAADAVIVDLEDAVLPDRRGPAREMARDVLPKLANKELWVRINPLGSDDAEADLNAVMPAAPFGIVLPKPEGAGDVDRLASLLDRLEPGCGCEKGSTRVLPIVTERPSSLFRLNGYADASTRLAGLTWGAEDLGAALGATATRHPDGRWLPPYELARSLCLFAAAAAHVHAIDTVYTDYRDEEGLARYAANARRDGFDGMLAIHPAQAEIINAAFLPTRREIERANRIVALFAENPEAGTLGLDGEMIDRPHWLQANRILEKARKYGSGET